MRAIPRRRLPWPVKFAAIAAVYITLIAIGSALTGCAASAVDLNNDGVVSPDELAIDFEDRYATFVAFVRLGVSIAENEGEIDGEEKARIEAAIEAANAAAASYAADLRAGTPTAVSNRRMARTILFELAEYLAAGEAAEENAE